MRGTRADLFRGVSDGELLRVHGLFVTEGRLVVRRVIADSRYRVHSVLVNEAARRDLSDALARLPADVPILVAPTSEFRELTGYNIHRGCLALVHRPPMRSLDDVLARTGTLLMLEGVANADNVGGIFRNALALGATGVIVDPKCCDPLYRKAVRTSMGAVLRVPYAQAAEWGVAAAQTRAAGFWIAALTPHQPSTPLDEFARARRDDRVAFVLGAEGEGLSAAALANADERVRIPIIDGIDSINVAAAAGIALYAIHSRPG